MSQAQAPAHSAAFIQFMKQHWERQSAKPPKVHPYAAIYARRRAALAKHFPGEILVIPTGYEKIRANDTHFHFRAGSDFFYLTGNTEPDCVLVLTTQDGHQSHLFVEPNPGYSSEVFYTDRKRGALWVGPKLGVEGSRIRYAVNFVHELPSLTTFLEKHPPTRVLRGVCSRIDALIPTRKGDEELAVTLAELRLIKDAVEVTELKKSIASTKRGFEDVIRALGAIKTEREVEGVFCLRARKEGNNVGYNTIVASGAHACILHWTKNDGMLRQKDLLLLDAGVEGHALYTADITRTLPISGYFSAVQREIYHLVWRARRAALKAVRPGNDFLEPNRQAMRTLAIGLERLCILPSTANEALKPENQFYKRYTLHNVSHMLGLDVHDCAKAREEVYKYGTLRPGVVLTIEPGLYFQKDDLTVPSKYRGIGIRIEDDVLVTANGYINLSKSIPSEAKAVERWMRRVKKLNSTESH